MEPEAKKKKKRMRNLVENKVIDSKNSKIQKILLAVCGAKSQLYTNNG